MRNLSLDSSRWGFVNNILVGILALYGVANQNYKVDSVSVFDQLLIELLAPIQSGTLSMKKSITSAIDHYVMIVNTSKENIELKKEVAKLEGAVFSLQEVEKENERLKRLLEFGKDISHKKVLAQIVSWDSTNEFKVLRINKGSNHGLKELSPVITMTGLVGYVYRVTPNFADVLTILDQNNRVDTIVMRTRTHGIVEGTSSFKCRLKYVARTEKLELGDVILTAGLGEIYPKGIKVGTISKVDKESYGITQEIEITPSVDFYKLEEVVVLLEKSSTAQMTIGKEVGDS